MYLVKVNGNYNIVIHDIGVTLSSSAINSVVVEDDVFESSSHAKDLLATNIITVEKVKKGEEKVVEAPKKELENKVENTIFVAKEIKEAEVENIFVSQAPEEKEVKTEELVKEVATKETKVEETKVEKAEVVVEETKAEEKAPTKKTVTKRNNNNKVKK